MTRSAPWLLIMLALALGTTVGYGCRGGAGQGDAGTVAYACPMHCEEERTYDHPGTCPVCGMDLVEVRADGTLVMPEPPHPGGGTP